MAKKLRTIYATLAILVIVIITYVFIHELGHAIAAIAAGGRVIRLSVALAHTWYEGVGTAPWVASLVHIAGMLLPVLLLLAGLIFYRREIGGFCCQLTYGLFLVMTAASVLSWVFLPILSLFADLPPDDDVIKFLESSGLPPLAVTLLGVILIAGLLLIAAAKGMPRAVLCAVKTAMEETGGKGVTSSRTVGMVSAVMLGLIAVTAALEAPVLMSPPVLSLTISDPVTEKNCERKFSFMAPEDRTYDYEIELAASGYLTDIRIQDAEQDLVYENIAESISARGDLYLSAGEYTIYLTHLLDPEEFEGYCQAMGYTFDGDAQMIERLKAAYENEKQEPSFSLVVR